MLSIFNRSEYTSTEATDIIEKIVYVYLKPLGFRKYGRTLHRFVEGNISQVVHLQNGCPQKGVYGVLWVNLGIRVPESVERKFSICEPVKKYYQEYECNIRTTLGMYVDGKDTRYNLKKNPNKIGNDIVARLEKYVMPVFDTLNSRDAILKRRADYEKFDQINSDIRLLEDAMIMGRKGNIAEATRLFKAYYEKVLKEYNEEFENGVKAYLKKGQTMVYHNTRTNEIETIKATRNGYVTIYDANKGHLEYLEKLAEELGIVIS